MSHPLIRNEIISPINDQELPYRVSAADAKAQGRFAYEKPTAENILFYSLIIRLD